MWAGLQNLPSRLNAIDTWHLQVHQDHIRLQRGRQVNHLLARGCFPDDLDIGCRCEQGAHALAEERVIISDEDMEWIHRLTPSGQADAPGRASLVPRLPRSRMTRQLLPLVPASRAVRRLHAALWATPLHHR